MKKIHNNIFDYKVFVLELNWIESVKSQLHHLQKTFTVFEMWWKSDQLKVKSNFQNNLFILISF